jgi:hypothetical protein
VDEYPSITFTPDGLIMFEYYKNLISVRQVADGYTVLATLKHPKNHYFAYLYCTYQEGDFFLLNFNENNDELEVFRVSRSFEWCLTEAWVLKMDPQDSSSYGIVVSSRGSIFLKLHKRIIEISFRERKVVRVFQEHHGTSMCLSFNENDLFIVDRSCVRALSSTDGKTRTVYTSEKFNHDLTGSFVRGNHITMRGNQILVCRLDIETTFMYIWLSETGDFQGEYTLEGRFGAVEEEVLTVKNFVICPSIGRLWLSIDPYYYCKHVLEFE